MRKLVSMGLLAISATLAFSTASAYDVEMCEEFKGGTPGLYGLCIAFVNAPNDNARGSIEKNYAKQRGDTDPGTLEEFFGGGGDTCPCWSYDSLLAETEVLPPLGCISEPAAEYALFNDGSEVAAGDTTYVQPGDGLTECVRILATGGVFDVQATDAAENAVCLENLEDLQFVLGLEPCLVP